MTLVEVLAAISLLSITLITILALYRFNYMSGVDSLRHTVAANLARQGIESLRKGNITPVDSEDAPEFDGVTYDREYSITYDEDDELYNIIVRVKWINTLGKEQKVEFKLQRT